MSDRLRLGPLLRHVDDSSATVWVETEGPGEVEVRVGERTGHARTWAVHDHHYAMVEVTGLAPGTRTPYDVLVDGEHVWPPPDSPFPPSVVPTLEPGRPLRLAFGSCRVSVAHDEAGHREHGIDSLRAYALHLAGITHNDAPRQWPDLVLFLGDQVYADETSEEMRAFIQDRRDPEQSPWWELKDYEEYAHLYRIAWSDPANRWLLSTLPSAMIFDDHDIRDDWNTSRTWRDRIEATDWWEGRIRGGLASYWVYQHLGNLSPEERAADRYWRMITSYDGPGELDLSDELDELALRADREPDCYRWSFARRFDTQAKLTVVDSRAARVLEPDHRSILDPVEMEWLEEHLHGDVDHLLVGTSLPFLLQPALHHVEAFSEALANGAWGRRLGRLGESLRENLDLEHWAAFHEGFVQLGQWVVDVACGRKGAAPSTITFLSGDVHHSYVARAWPAEDVELETTIAQAVCSPIRNVLPRFLRWGTTLAAKGSARPTGRLLGDAVPRSPIRWRLVKGPWYDNNLAVLEVDGDDLEIVWWRGVVRGDDEHPAIEEVASHRVRGRGREPEEDRRGRSGRSLRHVVRRQRIRG